MPVFVWLAATSGFVILYFGLAGLSWFLPRRGLNFLDLESAIEISTPLYQLFLTDSGRG
jgi:hypothetical protein